MNLGDAHEALHHRGPAQEAYRTCVKLADDNKPELAADLASVLAIAAKCQAKLGYLDGRHGPGTESPGSEDQGRSGRLTSSRSSTRLREDPRRPWRSSNALSHSGLPCSSSSTILTSRPLRNHPVPEAHRATARPLKTKKNLRQRSRSNGAPRRIVPRGGLMQATSEATLPVTSPRSMPVTKKGSCRRCFRRSRSPSYASRSGPTARSTCRREASWPARKRWSPG